MAVKLPDTLVPMADFPSAFAKDVQFTDGENLQDKLDNGKLGSSSGGTGLTEEQANNIEKIPSIEGTVTSNSQAIANKADKEEVETISSQLDTIRANTYNKTEVDDKISEIILESGNMVLRDVLEGEVFKLGTSTTPTVTYGNIIISTTTLSVDEKAKITFTVKLDKPPTNNQVVNITVNNNYCTINPATLTFTSSNYNQSQTVTVTGTHDSSHYSTKNSSITVSSANVTSKYITVTINNIDSQPTETVPVKSVSLNKPTHTMKVGETIQLTPVISPSNATNQEVTWETNNSNCSVIEGLVTANVEGECIITCKTVDGNKTDNCTITVQAKENQGSSDEDGLIMYLNGVGGSERHNEDYLTWIDQVGSNNYTFGTWAGNTPEKAWESEEYINLAYLDGANTYINSFKYSNITIDVEFEFLASKKLIINNGNIGATNSDGLVLNLNKSTAIVCSACGGASTGLYAWVNLPEELQEGVFYRFTATCDDTTFKLYLNGNLINTTTCVPFSSKLGSKFSFSGAKKYKFIKVYNRVLSESEISGVSTFMLNEDEPIVMLNEAKSTKITQLKEKVIEGISPITLATSVKVGDGTDKNILDFIHEKALSSSTPSNSKNGLSIIKGGTVKLILDLGNKKITWSDGYIYVDNNYINVSAGENILSNLNSWNWQYPSYIGYNPSTSKFDCVLTSNVTSYTGHIVFLYVYGTIFPINYPKQLIATCGTQKCTISDKWKENIRELTILGDSNSINKRWDTYFFNYMTIGKINNLAVFGHTIVQCNETQVSQVPSTTDLCVIMIGTNDAARKTPLGELKNDKSYDVTTFYGAYQSIIETLLEKNKGIRIILCTQLRTFGQESGGYTNENMRPLVEATKNVANHYGLPCFDTHNLMGINEYNQTYYLADTLHLNAEGGDLFARLLAKFIIANY